uniref:Reverse transcriptase domain-containing protein n=1 Tax=Tanacetum cinerariifolium TaxID=118510 RepID=A0A6L2MUL6_TANCI|nr:reverse transcriptase domain-containing protein [Tanacetum cinerariifolium]
MRTRTSSNLVGESSPSPTTSNLKRRNRRRSKQPFSLEESPLDTMADQRTMAELLHAPTEGYAEAIMVTLILAEHFELKDSLINMMTLDEFFGLEKVNLHDHIHWFNKITSTIKYKDVPNLAIKLMFFSFSLAGVARRWLEKEPPRSLKAIEEIYVTYGDAYPYYQCLAVDGNTFLEFQDNIKGYVSAAAVNYNQGNSGYRPLSVANQNRPPVVPLSELEKIKKINEVNIKSMQTQINNVKNKLRHEMQTSIQASMSNQTNELKNMMARFFQMNTASTLGSGSLPRNTIANPKGELNAITTRSGLVLDGLSILMPPLVINPEEDERVEETLTDPKLAEYTIKIPHPLKILELANTPLNENCSAVILKKLPKKLGDPGKFLILCSFSELKCKALADLGASINLMPLLFWKKLGLPEVISTRMTLKLANRAICTLAEIARDVFVPVGKFKFPADFVIVDYESDPRVPLILGRPFLRTARDLIDVHREEMILRDGDERLTLNMRHDTSNYSNQRHKESINMNDIYNDSYEDYFKDLFATNHLSGNPTFSSHTDLTSHEVINPLSSNTTSFSPDHLLKEFADELALITFPPRNDDLIFDIESDIREIEYLLNHDPTKEMDSILEDLIDEGNLADPNNDLVDTIPEMFIDEHTLDYLSLPLYDDVDDDLVELESDNDDIYDDPFDSKEDKIKDSKLLIDELDPLISSDFLPSRECDSILYEDFSEVDALPLTNNEDKELPFHKEVPGSESLLSFSSENEEKVFNLGILTSKGVHTSLLPELARFGQRSNV